MPTTLYGEHIVRKSIGNCCSHAAEIRRFHILRAAALEPYQLFPRCRNCTISHIALLPWNPINSVVPVLQKLHEFRYCVAALEPYQLFPRCRNCMISHIALLSWSCNSCSHAAEIARFHILHCCLGARSLVPTLQKLDDFTYCTAALEPYQLFTYFPNGIHVFDLAWADLG